MLKNSERKQTGRPRRSCDACYRRKIQCVGFSGVASCDWCLHHNLDCAFTPIRRQAMQATAAENDTSDTPVILDHAPLGLSTEPSPGPTSRAGRPVYDEGSLATCERATLPFTNIPLLSYAAPKLFETENGVLGALRTIVPSGYPWVKPVSPSHNDSALSNPTDIKLPDRFVVEASVAFYAANLTGLLRAVPRIAMVRRAIDTAYSPLPHLSEEEINQSNALVYAFVAYCSLAGHSQERNYPVDERGLITGANLFVPSDGNSPSSLEGLQVPLLLVLCHCILGELLEARKVLWHLSYQLTELSSNSHMFESFPMGLARRLASRDEQQTVLCEFFWLSLTVDNDIFLRTGQAPILLTNLFSESLPCPYESAPEFMAGFLPPRSEDARADIYVYMIELTLHISRLYIRLCAPQTSLKSSIETLQTIMLLDDELEQWRLSIPDPLRPTIHVSKLPTQSLSDTEILALNMKFHHVLGCIHQAVRRCQSWSWETTSASREALESSLQVSFQASVSSLKLLRATKLVLDPENFWYLCFYPISAHLNLLCKIVSDPMDTTSHSYLQMLQDFPVFLRQIDTRHFTLTEIDHLSFLIEFSTELVNRARFKVIG